MDNPKISVLIPMYNRKYCIQYCIDSALNQTFQDFEIIVRDNCSNDGSYEFVQEKYSQQINEGKIRLYKNEENIGLYKSQEAAIKVAKGKYFTILHSDDMILPHALQHLNEIVEKTNADVVHQSVCLDMPDGKFSSNLNDLKPSRLDATLFDGVVILPDDPNVRFSQWFSSGTMHDTQYNLFNKEFALNNELFSYEHDCYYTALLWIMLSKVLVKTSLPCYIRSNLQDAGKNSDFSCELFLFILKDIFQSIQDMDKFFPKVEFFRNNEHLQYTAKSRYISMQEVFFIISKKAYKDGITPELYDTAKEFFKKVFGDNYFYPMYLSNRLYTIIQGQRVDVINSSSKDASGK